MKALVATLLLLSGAAFSAPPAIPKLQLDDNAVSVELGSGQRITACTARLEYIDNDGFPMPTHDGFLVLFGGGEPTVVGTIRGFKISLELRDVDGDGRMELLAFFHAGANQFGLSLFRIGRYEVVPLRDQPTTSNMRSIKVADGEVHVEVNKGLSANEAVIETHRYRLDGNRLLEMGISKRGIAH
jgi:hypothetical protein